MIKRFKNRQRGAVSLFVVIFATLLIAVVTVSFIRLMTQGQLQSSLSDLSQSAYDSSQAGVEDAKRAILRYQEICNSGDAAACDAAKAQIGTISSPCNQAVGALVDVNDAKTDSEVKVQNRSTSNALDQAYTCTKIQLETVDVVGELQKDVSKLIPLKGTQSFNTVKVEWFTRDDLSASFNNEIEIEPGASSTWPLHAPGSWAGSRPSIIRAQLIQFSDNGFTLADMDNSTPGQSNVHTLFLYPSSSTADTAEFRTRDIRRQYSSSPMGRPFPASCRSNISTGGYACSMRLVLPPAINGSGDNRTAYLNLKSIYKKANYRVTLMNGAGGSVEFDGVQPLVDSTGRANDLFRRVEARVELSVPFPYPEAEISTSHDLCKDFLITNATSDFPTINTITNVSGVVTINGCTP